MPGTHSQIVMPTNRPPQAYQQAPPKPNRPPQADEGVTPQQTVRYRRISSRFPAVVILPDCVKKTWAQARAHPRTRGD